MNQPLGLTHRYLPPDGDDQPTLVLLHGTGGTEDDLLPLGRQLADGAALLSPRGAVSENGMPRWFRRLAEGVFDQEDLAARSDELAGFLSDAAAAYELPADRLIGVGFSNGANMAGSLLLRHPGVLRAAVLFAPMLPFEPETLPNLSQTGVFISAGRTDPICPADQSERLAELLDEAGAAVTLCWHAGGHTVDAAHVEQVRDWLTKLRSAIAAEGGRPLP